MNPYVLRWEAGDFLFHRYEKPFWKDIDSEEVLEVGDVAKKLNSLEAQVEALIEVGNKLRGDSGTHAMQTYNKIAAEHCDEWDALLTTLSAQREETDGE